MELICVRHGRTAWNADKRFQGQTDVPLDDEGRAQAKALAAMLRGERIDAAVSSDLVRAAETARIVLGARDLELRLDPELREMNFGAWEGLTWEQIRALSPDGTAGRETAVHEYAPSGGETFEALCARTARAVERAIQGLPEDGAVLVATHAGPLHALLRVLLPDAERPVVRFSTASVTRFRRGDGIWTLARLNQTALYAS